MWCVYRVFMTKRADFMTEETSHSECASNHVAVLIDVLCNCVSGTHEC